MCVRVVGKNSNGQDAPTAPHAGAADEEDRNAQLRRVNASAGMRPGNGAAADRQFSRNGGTVPAADMDLSALANWSMSEVRNASIDIVRLTSVTTATANALVQPFAFGRAYLTKHGRTEEGLNGLKFAVLSNAAILGHPVGTKPPSWAELKARARRVAQGDWMAEWRERQREARAQDAKRREGTVIQPESESVAELIRKARKALKQVDEGKESKALGEFGAPPVLNGGAPETQELVLDLTKQCPPPRAEKYADEPGVKAFVPDKKLLRATYENARMGAAYGTLKVPMETYRVFARACDFEPEYELASMCFAGELHPSVAYQMAWVRLCVLCKGKDPETGKQRGRPLGMPEDDRRLWGSCMCKQDKGLHQRFFTGMLPEDEKAWRAQYDACAAEARAAAEAAGVADVGAFVNAVTDTGVGSYAEATGDTAASEAMHAAEVALAAASVKPKVPVNLGIGTAAGAALTHLTVRGWTEKCPTNAQLCGDVENMFNLSDREAEADALREYFPQYLPWARTWYAIPAPIHLGSRGGLIVVTGVEGAEGERGVRVVKQQSSASEAIRWGEPVVSASVPAAAAKAAGVRRAASSAGEEDDTGAERVNVPSSASASTLSMASALACSLLASAASHAAAYPTSPPTALKQSTRPFACAGEPLIVLSKTLIAASVASYEKTSALSSRSLAPQSALHTSHLMA